MHEICVCQYQFISAHIRLNWRGSRPISVDIWLIYMSLNFQALLYLFKSDFQICLLYEQI